MTINHEELDLSTWTSQQFRALYIAMALECSKRRGYNLQLIDVPNSRVPIVTTGKPDCTSDVRNLILENLENVEDVKNVSFINLYSGLPGVLFEVDGSLIAPALPANALLVDKYCNCYRMLITYIDPEKLAAKKKIQSLKEEIALLQTRHNI